jgi:hypothetical protein
LLGTAEFLGHYRYVELECFERLGALAPRVEQPFLASYLAGAARAHAYRAALIEALLPVSVGLPGAVELTISPDSRLEGAFEELLDRDEEALLGELVLVAYPALLAGYRARFARCSMFSDPPLRRCLVRLMADLAAQIEEGEALVTTRPTEHDSGLQGVLARLDGSLQVGRPTD